MHTDSPVSSSPVTAPVRVRFAPSPTGHQHIGGLRTALYNYLFARKHGGTYILRIEDTDQSRYVEGAIESTAKTLDFFGLGADEGVVWRDGQLAQVGERGPYIQSERLPIYREHAERLVASGHAYYCFCAPERLQAMRAGQAAQKLPPKYDKQCLALEKEVIQERLQEPGAGFVIRLNVSADRGEIRYTDLVRGEVSFQAKEVDDQVLIKSDGFPTYHLAMAVDDHLMGITHVFRSEEWLPSTPKHILLYEAFGWEPPAIGHISFILGPGGKKKLSKRDGGVMAEDFLARGYLPEALINFLVLLGWNPGQGSTQEIFSLAELEQVFDVSGLHKAGAVFDEKKLDWMNGEYIKRLPIDELYARARNGGFFAKDLINIAPEAQRSEAFLKKVLTVEQDRLARLDQIGEQNPFFFTDELVYDTALLPWKENSPEATREALLRAEEVLHGLAPEDWDDKARLETVLLEAADNFGTEPAQNSVSTGARTPAAKGNRGNFLWPLRAALTGAQRSPSPMEVAWVLGSELSLARIRKAIARLG